LFYGWAIVGIAITSMTLIYGVRHSFSVFFPSILDEFGWGRGSTSSILSMHILLYGIAAPFAGTLGDRWQPRRIMPIGVLILGSAAALCGFANQLWHFYLIYGLFTPLGLAFCGWPLLSPALANWFHKRRGLAMAIGQIGGGMSFVYSIFAEFLISHLGWRLAFVVMGVVLASILMPLYVFFFYYHPRDKGLKAYGADDLTNSIDKSVNQLQNRDTDQTNWSLKDAVKTYQLWLLVFSQFLFWGIGCYLVLAHQVKFAMDVGFSNLFAASIFGLFGVFMIVGQLSSSISDWIGREWTVAISSSFCVVALIALLSVGDASQSWLLYVYAICFGLGAGLFAPTVFVGAADIFHGPHFGSISGLMLTGMGVGGALGPWMGGYLHDATGTYFSAFVLCLICFVLAGVAFIVAAPRHAASPAYS
jgi:sugar phosphate permease